MADMFSPALALSMGNIFLLLSLAMFHVSAAPAIGGGGGGGGSSGSGAAAGRISGAMEFIRKKCNLTRYPAVCFSSISGYAGLVQQSHTQLARVAITVSLSQTKAAHRYVGNLSISASTVNDSLAKMALQDCTETFSDAISWTQQSLDELQYIYTGNFRWRMNNILTWMSAALTDVQTCADGFEGVSTIPGLVLKAVTAKQVSYVSQFTSNALALLNYLSNLYGLR